MKRFISLLLVLMIVLAFAGCGPAPEADNGPSVEGTWLCSEEEGGYGYAFDPLKTTEDCDREGQVFMRPAPVIDYGILYAYCFTGENEIEIVRYSPSADGDLSSAVPEDYDTLRIEEENGKRVLVSTVTDMKYYFQEDAE